MLQKFGDIDDGEADAPAPRMARVVKATKKSPEDLAALQTWADTAPIGAEKELQVPLGSACTCSSWEVFNDVMITSSTAQGGGGSFKNRKPIGELGCCESGMAEHSH